MLVEDLECVFIMLERSPPHLLLYCFYLTEKIKVEPNKGSTSCNTREPMIYLLLFIIYDYHIFLAYAFITLFIYLLVHQTFYLLE